LLDATCTKGRENQNYKQSNLPKIIYNKFSADQAV